MSAARRPEPPAVPRAYGIVGVEVLADHATKVATLISTVNQKLSAH